MARRPLLSTRRSFTRLSVLIFIHFLAYYSNQLQPGSRGISGAVRVPGEIERIPSDLLINSVSRGAQHAHSLGPRLLPRVYK